MGGGDKRLKVRQGVMTVGIVSFSGSCQGGAPRGAAGVSLKQALNSTPCNST